MFYGALLTFATSILLPYFVEDPDTRPKGVESLSFGAEANPDISRSIGQTTSNRRRFTVGLSLCWQFAHVMFGLLLLSTWYALAATCGALLTAISRFITTVYAATVMFALQGVCSAVSHWVPFALVSLFQTISKHLLNQGQIATAAHKDAAKSSKPDEEYLASGLSLEQQYLLNRSASGYRGREEFAGDAPNRAGLFLVIMILLFIYFPTF